MRTPGDAAAVTAAQRGEPGALDALVADYLPLVYNVVGRALGGHPDTDDVVQETMLRAVDGLAKLQDPESFRSWLLVIAMNQVRDRHRRNAPLPVDHEVLDRADPGADFADYAITRLQLRGQRREVVAATRWIGDDERELLSLWWLESVGRITRAELAEALDLTPQHAAVRVQRMKAQLDAARVVVRVLAMPRCDDLAAVVSGWDGVPAALWRKRIVRHARECDRCARGFDDLANVDGLVARIPLVPLPPGLDLLGQTGTAVLPADPAVGAARHRPKAAIAVKKGSGARRSQAAGRRCGRGGGRGRVCCRTTRHAAAGSRAGRRRTTTTAPSHRTHHDGHDHHDTTAATTTAAGRRRPATRRPAARVEGVSTWHFDGVTRALSDIGAGWVYNWATTPENVQVPPGVEYVPMVWGAKTVTPADLEAVARQGTTLLGFNEPDLAEQSNMTVEQALDLWPRLQATGMRLGSPAVAHSADKPGGWLDRFMAGAEQRGLRVDFIALHWYGSDFGPAAVGHLKNYLDAVSARYGLPVWLTEYSLMDFSGGGVRYPDERQLADFAGGSSRMLEGLPYLERYAWFALPADKPGTGLYLPGGTPNRAGVAYRATVLGSARRRWSCWGGGQLGDLRVGRSLSCADELGDPSAVPLDDQDRARRPAAGVRHRPVRGAREAARRRGRRHPRQRHGPDGVPADRVRDARRRTAPPAELPARQGGRGAPPGGWRVRVQLPARAALRQRVVRARHAVRLGAERLRVGRGPGRAARLRRPPGVAGAEVREVAGAPRPAVPDGGPAAGR
ncbi:sigma-70 family RNA polymerase sigma factor [Saccharothrix sp. MB29]|nr:sigma-70 family RNA polymerase sigma factor [Saccharothrix sp. MB29]